MSLSTRILALLAALAVAFSAGFGVALWKSHRDKLADDLASERGARVLEAQGARRAAENADVLTQDRLRTERAAAGASERLRKLAEAAPDPPASCPSRNDDPRAPAAVLHDRDREDLVALAAVCDAVSDRLRAAQRELSEASLRE